LLPLTAFDARMLSSILRLQIMETSSFCLVNLLGLVKCLAEFLLRLLVKAWLSHGRKKDCKAVGENNIQITLWRE